MNLSKLMITLTLGCLSIVAIAALALLPITDGICEDNPQPFTERWNNSVAYKKKYGAHHDENNWSFEAYVDAKGVSAYAGASANHAGAVFASHV